MSAVDRVIVPQEQAQVDPRDLSLPPEAATVEFASLEDETGGFTTIVARAASAGPWAEEPVQVAGRQDGAGMAEGMALAGGVLAVGSAFGFSRRRAAQVDAAMEQLCDRPHGRRAQLSRRLWRSLRPTRRN
jgi:hypothetical protein